MERCHTKVVETPKKWLYPFIGLGYHPIVVQELEAAIAIIEGVTDFGEAGGHDFFGYGLTNQVYTPITFVIRHGLFVFYVSWAAKFAIEARTVVFKLHLKIYITKFAVVDIINVVVLVGFAGLGHDLLNSAGRTRQLARGVRWCSGLAGLFGGGLQRHWSGLS